jgi:hypothetical protein
MPPTIGPINTIAEIRKNFGLKDPKTAKHDGVSDGAILMALMTAKRSVINITGRGMYDSGAPIPRDVKDAEANFTLFHLLLQIPAALAFSIHADYREKRKEYFTVGTMLAKPYRAGGAVSARV